MVFEILIFEISKLNCIFKTENSWGLWWETYIRLVHFVFAIEPCRLDWTHICCIEFISPQGLGIENMDKSHISLQLMGDSIQVLICCGCMVKPGQKKQPVLEERKDCMEKNVGSVYVQCINIFFLKLNWTTLNYKLKWLLYGKNSKNLFYGQWSDSKIDFLKLPKNFHFVMNKMYEN